MSARGCRLTREWSVIVLISQHALAPVYILHLSYTRHFHNIPFCLSRFFHCHCSASSRFRFLTRRILSTSSYANEMRGTDSVLPLKFMRSSVQPASLWHRPTAETDLNSAKESKNNKNKKSSLSNDKKELQIIHEKEILANIFLLSFRYWPKRFWLISDSWRSFFVTVAYQDSFT